MLHEPRAYEHIGVDQPWAQADKISYTVALLADPEPLVQTVTVAIEELSA